MFLCSHWLVAWQQNDDSDTDHFKILEHQSALAGKGRELKDFLEKCIEESAKELDDLAEGDAKVFVKKLRRFEKGISLEAEKKDGHLLFRMAAANVGCHDPEFLRRRGKLLVISSEFVRGFDSCTKVSFPLNNA